MPTITLIKSDLTTKKMHPNPKEKAKELIDNMLCHNWHNKEYSKGFGVTGTKTVYRKENAILCALVCCDEIINFLNRCPSFNKGKETDEIWSYWQQVKEELTNQK